MISHKLIVVKSVDKGRDMRASKNLPFWVEYRIKPRFPRTEAMCATHRRTRGVSHNNAIKHEKGDPLDFLTTPSTPLKRILLPKPQGPIPWISNYLLCIYGATDDVSVTPHPLFILLFRTTPSTRGSQPGGHFNIKPVFLV